MSSRRSLVATLLPALVVVLVVGAGCVVAAVMSGPNGDIGQQTAGSGTVTGPPAVRPSTQRTGAVAALALLRQWDERRASAYASGDARALRRLYAPGSVAAAADVALLRSYTARHLVVEGMHMQVLDIRVLQEETGRVVLRVRDRLAGAEVVSKDGRSTLPADQPDARTLTLVRLDGRWVLSAVRPG